MIKCPKCKSANTCVKGSCKYIDENNLYQRVKICNDCGHKFKTVEAVKENYDSAVAIAKGILDLIKANLYQ